MRHLDGQMALDLFADERPKPKTAADWADTCIAWLVKCYGCVDEDVRPTVEAVYAMFPYVEAFDRCKALTPIPGWSIEDMADVFGVFDIDHYHHVCWDRHWAALKGYPRDEIAKIIAWDYMQDKPTWRDE